VIEGVFLINKIKPEGAESPNCGSSVVTAKPAIDGHLKTGQWN
jgi:hypothetical protein